MTRPAVGERPYVLKPATFNKLVQIINDYDRGLLKNRPERPLPPASPRPILAKITAIQANYLICKRMIQNPSNAEWSVPVGTPEFNVAKHPALQKQFYDGVSEQDPIGSKTYTFTYVGSQQRSVSDGAATQNQRIIPWYSLGDDAVPILALPMSLYVKNDAGDGVVSCTYIDGGPAMWAKSDL